MTTNIPQYLPPSPQEYGEIIVLKEGEELPSFAPYRESIQIKPLHPKANIPRKAHDEDAGLDLFSDDVEGLTSGERRLIGTGVAVMVPNGYVGLVCPRSGMSKRGLIVTLGVLDAGYTGELMVNLYNTDERTQWVNQGDRIAQLVVMPVANLPVDVVSELPETRRGTGGFGSTGR